MRHDARQSTTLAMDCGALASSGDRARYEPATIIAACRLTFDWQYGQSLALLASGQHPGNDLPRVQQDGSVLLCGEFDEAQSPE